MLNVDELNAYKVAYGRPLKVKDYVYYVGLPALVFGIFSFIVLYYWWLSLIMFVIGAIYGIKVFLPKNIEKNYQTKSFRQRNKFVNNMTQILTDESKTVTKALATATTRANGEFKDDLNILQAKLVGADNQQIKEGFKWLLSKYDDDVIFVQYMEQLETAMLEGRANTDTLKDIKTYHNEIKEKQDEYERKKQGHLKDMKMLCFVVLVFILSVSFSFGFNTYVNDFAHHPTGWVSCGVYLLLMGQFFRKFSTYLFDDSIMEVKL
ncbi:hypothetical protein [Virgibacillus halodenitrificans]|uniref:hypothetical protein n=1 Tax=Virgibacillus halodenitrificans TaxID=1482 RepID=UPI00098600DE|nr:hypothetical protein [Virgibacillus halodenitrificans]